MFAFILQLPSVAKCQVMFTLYRVAFALAKNWPYRIGLLFTHKNGDFGAISVAGRRYEAPISKVESDISDRCSYYTGYSVNIASDWNLGTHRRHTCGSERLEKIAEDVTRFLRRRFDSLLPTLSRIRPIIFSKVSIYLSRTDRLKLPTAECDEQVCFPL